MLEVVDISKLPRIHMQGAIKRIIFSLSSLPNHLKLGFRPMIFDCGVHRVNFTNAVTYMIYTMALPAQQRYPISCCHVLTILSLQNLL